jgi:hypothetical protein
MNYIIILTISLVGLFSSLLGETFTKDLSISKKDEFPYRAPSARQLEYETPEKILIYLTLHGVTAKHYDFWQELVRQEEKGFFGYQAAKQKFRIFQDIIKMIFEDILNIEIKKDFHFFRIPLDPSLNEHGDFQSFLDLYHPNAIDDGIPEQRNQIISLNYSLFGNYQNPSQCTVCYFSDNFSWFSINYEQKLEFLFSELGIPRELIPPLFEAGSSILNFDSGVLYQFFDTSHYDANHHDPYDFVENLCYPAMAAGKYDYHVTVPLAALFEDSTPFKFDSHTGQLRLLMNTRSSLNPFSSLSIRRYDRLDPLEVQQYEQALREKIHQLPSDAQKVRSYKNKLMVFWYGK